MKRSESHLKIWSCTINAPMSKNGMIQAEGSKKGRGRPKLILIYVVKK